MRMHIRAPAAAHHRARTLPTLPLRTCSRAPPRAHLADLAITYPRSLSHMQCTTPPRAHAIAPALQTSLKPTCQTSHFPLATCARSEERRVGKEITTLAQPNSQHAHAHSCTCSRAPPRAHLADLAITYLQPRTTARAPCRPCHYVPALALPHAMHHAAASPRHRAGAPNLTQTDMPNFPLPTCHLR